MHRPNCDDVAAKLIDKQGKQGIQVSSGADGDSLASRARLALELRSLRPSAAKMCAFCGEEKEKLLLCSKCKTARYCHADHQRQHWWGVFSFEFIVVLLFVFKFVIPFVF